MMYEKDCSFRGCEGHESEADHQSVPRRQFSPRSTNPLGRLLNIVESHLWLGLQFYEGLLLCIFVDSKDQLVLLLIALSEVGWSRVVLAKFGEPLGTSVNLFVWTTTLSQLVQCWSVTSRYFHIRLGRSDPVLEARINAHLPP